MPAFDKDPAARTRKRNRTHRRRGRAVLAWALLTFALAQVAFLAMRERYYPAICDPEFGRKITSLRARLRETPSQRPLVLTLGNSRLAMALRPDLLWPGLSSASRPATVFNFCICGASPIQEWMCLERILATGIQPDRLIIEVWPPLLSKKYYDKVGVWTMDRSLSRYQLSDMSVLAATHPDPRGMAVRWTRMQFVPFYSYRTNVLNALNPSFIPKEKRTEITYKLLDDWGFLRIEELSAHPPPKAFETSAKGARQFVSNHLTPFRVSDAMDHAQRAILGLAKSRNIPVTLILMPEPEAVREWYRLAPEAQELDNYLAKLMREFNANLVDARAWVPDFAFADAHHLTPDGATLFTPIFQRNVLDPTIPTTRNQPEPLSRPGTK